MDLCHDVGSVFAPSEAVSGLVGQGVSPDVAAFACAQYYWFCASTRGGYGGNRLFHTGGRNEDGHGAECVVGSRVPVSRSGDTVVGGVGRSDEACVADVTLEAGAGAGRGVCAGAVSGGDGAVDSGERSESGVIGRESGTEEVSVKTLANREKRRKARAAKLRKQSEAAEEVVERRVPEWRQKSPGALVHKGAFSGCSKETQSDLTETRAQMMIAKNRAAAAKAKESERQTAAMLKSRMIEERVERERLELEKKMKVLRDAAVPPQGYCETVLSALATPSLSDGTVSPDSSISMAEVHKKDEAIKMLVDRCEEQRKRVEKAELATQELAAKFEKFRLVTRESTLERARRDREREVEQRGQRGESRWNGAKAAYDSGAREYRGDETTKVAWLASDEV